MKKVVAIIVLIIVIAVGFVMLSPKEQSKPVSSTNVVSEEANVFFGRWGVGRATLDITKENDEIKASIQWASSAAEYSKWEYVCVYESESNRLACTGKKINITINEDETEDTKVIYENGKAYFTIVEGKIIWDDTKEDAGRYMLFSK